MPSRRGRPRNVSNDSIRISKSGNYVKLFAKYNNRWYATALDDAFSKIGDITDVSLTGDSGGALSHASGSADFTIAGGTNCASVGSGSTITVNVDDAFIKNNTHDIMAVSDFGAQAAFKIDADQPATTTTENSTGLHIDYDRIVAGSGTAAHNDIGIDLDVNSASLGSSTVKGMDIDVVGATSGIHVATGIDINVGGADVNRGLDITVPDGASDYHIKLMAADDDDDYATFAVADTGDLTIATVGDGTTDSDLTLDVDGDIELNADGGNILFKDDSTVIGEINSDNSGTALFNHAIFTGDVAISTSSKLYFDGGGDTWIEEDPADGLLFNLGGTTVFQLREAGVHGDVADFGTSGAGFEQGTTTYNASDTDVEFDLKGNKSFLTFGAGNIADLNLNFPNVSCNCILLVKQDGTGDRLITNYKTFDEAGGNEGTVVWAGGSNPTLTTTGDKVDILSFYWDNDNHKAYGTITHNF